jgi:predicted TIM-barrel enzyme
MFRNETQSVRSVGLMGGVAFKYTLESTDNPERAYAEAAELKNRVDIMVTSGPETGMPPSVPKVARMREAIGEQPLVIASGISIENIDKFGPYVDSVLVSTSIETTPQSGIFDDSAMQALIERAHALAR